MPCCAGIQLFLACCRTMRTVADSMLGMCCTFLQDQQSMLQSHAQDVQRRSERVEELVTETEPRTR